MPVEFRALLILSAILTLSACGASKALKSEDEAAIDSISVAHEVKVENDPMVTGSEAALGIFLGVAGATAAAETQKTAGEKFSEFLKASGIDIREIVRQRFTAQLRQDPRYGPRLAEVGRYRFVLEVPAYGMNKTNTFSSQWVVMLRINYQLVSPDGKALAQDWAMTSPFAKRMQFTTDEIQAKPQILQQAFEDAAAEVVAKLIKR